MVTLTFDPASKKRIDLGTELLVLDDGLLLILARLSRLLRRLVFELAVVHDLAHRRLGVGCDFDQIEIGVRGNAESIFDAHDAYLFAVRSDQPDFRYADALVDACLSADGASLVVPLRCAEATPSSAFCPQEQKSPAKKQGPMPTDHGSRRLRTTQNRHLKCL